MAGRSLVAAVVAGYAKSAADALEDSWRNLVAGSCCPTLQLNIADALRLHHYWAGSFNTRTFKASLRQP